MSLCEDLVEAPRRARDCAMLCLKSTSSCSLDGAGGRSREAGAKDLLLLSCINISVPAQAAHEMRDMAVVEC